MSESLRSLFGPDPGAALAAGFVCANLAGAAAILAVALARLPARRAFGPEASYRLWAIPPLAAAFAAVVVLTPTDADTGSAAVRAVAALAAPEGLIFAAWIAGVLATALIFTLAQARFLAEVRAGRAGPAVVGLISPRIVMPADDGRYSREERELIRAHEREHVGRKDPRAAAFAALAQCVCWFNPFVHLAARLIRLDQELACDAAVVLARPRARALYAKTLLKTQLAATPLPFGCYWPARGLHPLEVRVGLLKRRSDKASAGSGAAVVMPSVDAIRP